MAFRTIPKVIADKLVNINNRYVKVAVVKNLKENEIGNYRGLGFRIVDDNLIFESILIPPSVAGQASKRNRQDREIPRYDLPKVEKEIFLGLRPIYGDWSNGSFMLFQDRDVYQKDFIPAKNMCLKTTLIDNRVVDGNRVFSIKFEIDDILDREDPNFENDFILSLGLLDENAKGIDVFDAEATEAEYRQNIYVDWEIFPAGERQNLINRLRGSYRALTAEKREKIDRSIALLESMRPREYVFGMSGSNRYIGAKFKENLVVFENLDYGNAVYVLYEDWRTLSRKSRTELLTRKDFTFDRIIHIGEWQEKLKGLVEHKR